ncbi:DUF2071 domain-containing protein [Microbacterium sp. LRZ72]|uniref:YqjF family protein n=1 Tax=Microbacterium sp. LRZ72 TaxID=2942481 RepID=UPI0029B0F805|nr:DUF2071 domain-containing protein [Microbacterium sp. LRZ72]MDX2376963.1 DUF2071 domain-containing protein [Microbacterium sp. LRZ72]
MTARDAEAPPLPGRAIIRQQWGEVSFLHWRVEPARVAPMLPPGTRPDVFDGSSWVGLIGFMLSGHRFLPLPPVPVLGTFAEINVRLYSIDDNDERGVVFLSLDADRLLPVLAANALYGLPYTWSRVAAVRRGDTWRYRSVRHTGGRVGTRFSVRGLGEADDTPLAHHLTARWGFHEAVRGRTIYGRNIHSPWPLQRGRLLSLDDDLLEAAGFEGLAASEPASVLVSPGAVVTDFARPSTVTASGRRR